MSQHSEIGYTAPLVASYVEESQSQSQEHGGVVEATQPQQEPLAPHLPPWEEDDVWGVLEPIPYRAGRECLVFRLGQLSYTMGRDRELVDYVLDDNYISAKHFTVTRYEKEPRSVSIQDNNSRNGTFVRGERIGKGQFAVLSEGSEVAVGKLKFDESSGAEDPAWRYVYRVGHKATKKDMAALHRVYDVQYDRELGSGAFGTVCEALHMAEGVSYAVKFVERTRLRRQGKTGRLGDAEALDIPREIAIMKGLQHRHICQMKEYFISAERIALVLELLKGGNLATYRDTRSPMREAEVQYFTYQICDALSFLHSQGIVHRDLKPENVLLTQDDPPVAKVADFGLAKMVDEKTLLRTWCGTPAYIAPEIHERQPSGYSSAVDSWSIGIMTYEMVVSTSLVMDRVSSRLPKIRWKVLKSQMSRQGCSFVKSLLEVDPSRRMTMALACEHRWLARQAGDPLAIHEADAEEEGDADDATEDLTEEGLTDWDDEESDNASVEEGSENTTQRSASWQDWGVDGRPSVGGTNSQASTERWESHFRLTDLPLSSLETAPDARGDSSADHTSKKRKTWHQSYCVSLGSVSGRETVLSGVGGNDTGYLTLPTTASGATALRAPDETVDALDRLPTLKRTRSQRSAYSDGDTDTAEE
ncbi:kinase-like protein [Trametes cingulata]|nr:kinase-like protein [Trametes cingulata]